MFGWLRQKSRRLEPEEKWSVVVEDEVITVIDPDGQSSGMAISELSRIVVETNDQGPWLADVWWLLFNAEGEGACGFPQGATGEKAALDRLFALPGFDHDTVGKAMGCTENATFEVWRQPVPSPRPSRGEG